MKIYGVTASPFVRMTLVTAHELGLHDQIEQIGEAVDVTAANPKLVELSAIGKVPVLVTDHSHPIYDSRVIMEYLCHHTGNVDLLPREGVKRFRTLTLQALGIGLAEAAVALRLERSKRPDNLRWHDWEERVVMRITTICQSAETDWLTDLRDVHLGSIALACALGYLDLRFANLFWRESCPKLASFYEHFSKRESMQQTVPS